MTAPTVGFRQLVLILVVLVLRFAPSFASEWRTVSLPARALNITENNGNIWVCGAEELIAVSADGGKTWTIKHTVKNGRLLLSLGFPSDLLARSFESFPRRPASFCSSHLQLSEEQVSIRPMREIGSR